MPHQGNPRGASYFGGLRVEGSGLTNYRMTYMIVVSLITKETTNLDTRMLYQSQVFD